MKERGTYFDPTIATVADLIEPGGDYDNPILSIRGRHIFPESARDVGESLEAGNQTGRGHGHRLRPEQQSPNAA